MKKSTLPLALAAIAVTVFTTNADARGVFGLGGSRLAEYDTDGDGVLSDEEKAAAKEAREAARQAFIDVHDTDGDGVLNEEERAAAREAREAERARAKEERFNEIDGDGDGEVSQEELATALPEASEERVAQVLARYDADENGTISVDEFLNPERPERANRGNKRGKRGSVSRRRGRAIGIRGGRRGGNDDGGGDDAPAGDPTE